MAVETQDNSSTSEDLVKSLGEMNDFAQFKMGDSGADSETSVSESTSKEPSEVQPTPEAENRGNSDETAKTSSQEEAKAPTDTTQEAASKRTDTKKSQAVPYERFSQVTAEKNEFKAKYEELLKKQSEAPKVEPQEQGKAESIEIDDIPAKPAHDIKQLEDALEKYEDLLEEARLSQDLAKVNECRSMIKIIRGEIKSVNEYDSKYKDAISRHQYEKSYYSKQIESKWPEITNPESEIGKTYGNLKNVLSKHLPKITNNPRASWFIAQASEWYLKSVRLDAAEEATKKKDEEISRLTKAQQPLTTTEAPSVGSSNEKANVPSISSLASALKQMRR
jgi:hypothetical protein